MFRELIERKDVDELFVRHNRPAIVPRLAAKTIRQPRHQSADGIGIVVYRSVHVVRHGGLARSLFAR